MKNKELLPRVLGQSEILDLRARLLTIQRNGSTKDIFEKYLPINVLNKLALDDSKKQYTDIVESLVRSLDDRLQIELTIAFEPSLVFLKKLRSWVIGTFKEPATLSIKISPAIGGGVVLMTAGRRYNHSLFSSLLSHENLSRLSQ